MVDLEIGGAVSISFSSRSGRTQHVTGLRCLESSVWDGPFPSGADLLVLSFPASQATCQPSKSGRGGALITFLVN